MPAHAGRLIAASQRNTIIYITAYNAETREDETLFLIRWACKQAPLNEGACTDRIQSKVTAWYKNKIENLPLESKKQFFTEILVCLNCENAAI